jgi:acetyl esterase/lipase
MIVGNNRTGLDGLFSWVLDVGVIVVSIGYRLAPEFPDPTPVEDCYAALKWIFESGQDLSIDTDRIVLVGISAGGGLAAGVSLKARDLGWPNLAGQMLIGPMLDDRQDTPSSGELRGEGTWDRISNATGWTALLGERVGSEDVSQYAAPARASVLSELPPTFLEVGSVETFRDETVLFANRIWQAAGDAELHVWPGAFHGFDEAAPNAALSVDARYARTAWLRRCLRVEDF